MIFKKFSPILGGEILAFFVENTASFCKNWIATLVVRETPFPPPSENCRKL
jgi:hypothetical protein